MKQRHRNQLREQISRDVREFKSRGGVVQHKRPGATGMNPMTGRPIAKAHSYFVIKPENE
jgi:hypothetical protein|tara:strand:+ start:608 stop:787 length:180 start_codon:yes stop_codon:yes gene_type:complete